MVTSSASLSARRGGRPAGEPRRPRPAVARATLPVPAAEAWDLLVDVRNHVRWIPMTRIDAAWPMQPGEVFTAVSGPAALPRLGVVDRMRVEVMEPPASHAEGGRPGRAVLRKVGPLMHGTAEVHVRSAGPDASQVVWVERGVHLRGLPAALTEPLLRPVLGLMLRFALRGVTREIARR